MIAPHGCFGGCGGFCVCDIASPGALIADSTEKWYNQKQFDNSKNMRSRWGYHEVYSQ